MYFRWPVYYLYLCLCLCILYFLPVVFLVCHLQVPVLGKTCLLCIFQHLTLSSVLKPDNVNEGDMFSMSIMQWWWQPDKSIFLFDPVCLLTVPSSSGRALSSGQRAHNSLPLSGCRAACRKLKWFCNEAIWRDVLAQVTLNLFLRASATVNLCTTWNLLYS